MKNKHSRKEKSRLRLLMAAATFPTYQWYLKNARLRSTVAGQQAAVLGNGRAVMRHCTQAGVQRDGAHIQAET